MRTIFYRITATSMDRHLTHSREIRLCVSQFMPHCCCQAYVELGRILLAHALPHEDDTFDASWLPHTSWKPIIPCFADSPRPDCRLARAKVVYGVCEVPSMKVLTRGMRNERLKRFCLWFELALGLPFLVTLATDPLCHASCIILCKLVVVCPWESWGFECLGW